MYASRGCCVHIAAAAINAARTGTLNRLDQIRAAESAPMLLNAMEAALPAESTVRMQVSLIASWENEKQVRTGIELPELRIGLKIGENRLYVVRSLPDFIRKLDEGEPIDFGKGFSFRPDWMSFGAGEKKVISILRSLFAGMGPAVSSLRGADLREVLLPVPFAEQILEALQTVPFRFELDGEDYGVQTMRTTQLPLRFKVSARLKGLLVDAWLPRECTPLTADCQWIAAGQQLIRVEERQRPVVQVLCKRAIDHRATFAYTMQQAPRVVGELLPYLRLCGTV